MPDLTFQVTGAEAVSNGITPLLHFKLRISNNPSDELVQALILQAQIQVQPAQRSYSPAEQEKLSELFGTPDRWNQTLRNRLWGHSGTTTGSFRGMVEVALPLPCTYDLNILASRFGYAVEGGDIPLVFLFSGSVFYAGSDGRLQVQRISWEKESEYRMPATLWRQAMRCHFPNTSWLTLRNDVFERLYAYRRDQGTGTWEATIERLLAQVQGLEAKAKPQDNRTENTATNSVADPLEVAI